MRQVWLHVLPKDHAIFIALSQVPALPSLSIVGSSPPGFTTLCAPSASG